MVHLFLLLSFIKVVSLSPSLPQNTKSPPTKFYRRSCRPNSSNKSQPSTPLASTLGPWRPTHPANSLRMLWLLPRSLLHPWHPLFVPHPLRPAPKVFTGYFECLVFTGCFECLEGEKIMMVFSKGVLC